MIREYLFLRTKIKLYRKELKKIVAEGVKVNAEGVKQENGNDYIQNSKKVGLV
jgi:hypothetical protein